MGVKHLAGRPFTAARVDSTAPGPQSQKFCAFPRVLPIGDYPCLLKLQHWSHRVPAGRCRARSVGRPVLLDADPEVLGQLVGVAVGQARSARSMLRSVVVAIFTAAASSGWVSPLITRQSPG